jgi:hypothetical protein
MATQPGREPLMLLQNEQIDPVRCSAIIRRSNPLPSLPAAELEEEWQARLCNLQACLRELLLKNQQLRMALMEIKARVPEDDNGRNLSPNRRNPTGHRESGPA